MRKQNGKSDLSRRGFLASAAAATAALSAPAVLAEGRPRVVVVGGGAGGATAARYIAKDSNGAVDVTLVEPSRAYYTCFFSNLYIGGLSRVGVDRAQLRRNWQPITASTSCTTGRSPSTATGGASGSPAGTASPTTASSCRPASTFVTARFPVGTCRSRIACRTPTRRARKPSF